MSDKTNPVAIKGNKLLNSKCATAKINEDTKLAKIKLNFLYNAPKIIILHIISSKKGAKTTEFIMLINIRIGPKATNLSVIDTVRPTLISA